MGVVVGLPAVQLGFGGGTARRATTPRHAFVCFFDFGDHPLFSVKVAHGAEQAEGGSYPRVVSRQGKPPAPYDFYA